MSRIDQFRKMASDDPQNTVAHFSLGREYLTANQFADAEQSLRRVIELDPRFSKGYELLGTALLKQDRRDEAIDVLSRGVRQADERGDLMPRNAMVRMLQDLGAPVPELTTAKAPQQPVGEGEVHCVRCGRVGPKLAKPPMRGDLGQEIFAKVCADCWREWIPMGTKVINELRLPLSDPQAQRIYDQHMAEFLSLR